MPTSVFDNMQIQAALTLLSNYPIVDPTRMAAETTALMDAEQIARALDKLAWSVAQNRRGRAALALIGIRTRGVPLAARLAGRLRETHGITTPVGALDITLYRDDLSRTMHTPVLRGTHVPFAVDGMELVLVDDVLFTGRTVRAAMDELCDLGRPAAIRLAVLIDRGHRELPIQPDYCSLHVDTQFDERIEVRLMETDERDEVRRESASG
jgi:pyrimidine operon attenuation protein / uracil phosphoribosyltransferase